MCTHCHMCWIRMNTCVLILSTQTPSYPSIYLTNYLIRHVFSKHSFRDMFCLHQNMQWTQRNIDFHTCFSDLVLYIIETLGGFLTSLTKEMERHLPFETTNFCTYLLKFSTFIQEKYITKCRQKVLWRLSMLQILHNEFILKV